MKKAILGTVFILFIALPAAPTAQQTGSVADFSPDPNTVLRYGKGYRFPQMGWIVVHVEGEPYERGYQQGRLLPSEIAAYIRCFAQIMNYKAPEEGWKTIRTLANALFLRKFDKEYLEEMKGIADGAASAGARFGGRPIDLVDIVAANCWSEIETLDEAVTATPTGLETSLLPKAQPDGPPQPRPEHCSAFAATGPATADGKIVFGHVTMFPLYPSLFYNIWLDVQPATGHRFVMCAYPGAIYSAMDYYLNDAGILLNETTITQTKFNIQGKTLASRTRRAIQYGTSIDQVVESFIKDNNGLYTNEWMIADINTNEIAVLALGTNQHKLWRSSNNEWFGNTPGFYWSCNNAKDANVRLETFASAKGKPGKVVFVPQPRDVVFQQLYDKFKGHIGVDFAKEAFGNRIISAPRNTLDAKITTTDMARQLKSWATFGPPTGQTWSPTREEKDKYPEIKALTSNPWTILGIAPPAPGAGTQATPAAAIASAKDNLPLAWRGTLLPKTDGDIWLALAFADYEPQAAALRAALAKGDSPEDIRSQAEKFKAKLRREFDGAKLDVPLAELKSSTTSTAWYKLASAKGVLFLTQLRDLVGPALFDKTMDDFGMTYGGQLVTSAQFQDAFQRATGRNLEAFFDTWLRQKGLPEGS